MKILCYLITVTFINLTSFGQKVKTVNKDDNCKSKQINCINRVIYTDVDIEPTLHHKLELSKLIIKSLVVDSTWEPHVSQFYIQFVVESTGAVGQCFIIKGTNENAANKIFAKLKKEKFTPAKCNGKPVAYLKEVQMTICMMAEDE